MITANMCRIQPVMSDTAENLQEMVEHMPVENSIKELTISLVSRLTCLHHYLSATHCVSLSFSFTITSIIVTLYIHLPLSRHPFIHSCLCLQSLYFQFRSHTTQMLEIATKDKWFLSCLKFPSQTSMYAHTHTQTNSHYLWWHVLLQTSIFLLKFL